MKTLSGMKHFISESTAKLRITGMIFSSYSQNVLELCLMDEDVATGDDHLFTVSYDLGNVPLNEKVVESFTFNKEVQEELQVEFSLVIIPESQKKVTTNGVLVCPEMVALQVEVQKKRKEPFKKKTELSLSVQGSFEDSHKILLQSDSGHELNSHETVVFHFPRDLGSEMTASLDRVYSSFDVTFTDETESNRSTQTTIPLSLISPMENDINVQILSMEGKPLNTQIKLNECPEKLDVRLGFDLCEKEKLFLQKRQRRVADALKNILQLEEDLVGEEIPVVAVMATGGGARAMACLYSHLCGLQNMGLLDCVTYIASASGSTWTTSKLFEDPNWSQNKMSETINQVKKHVTKNKMHTFSMDRIKYYRKELQQAAKDGQKPSFTDLWGLILESMLYDGKTESRLSDQQAALDNGQNPLPIYLAINVKQDTISTLDFKEWCEFTPYEVGLLKYGAFIRTQDFGSEFYMGQLMKKHPEPRICFLQGLWGNVFSLNLVDTYYLTTQLDTFWDTWVKDRIKDIDEEDIREKREFAHTKTRLFTPAGIFNRILKGALTNRPIDGEQHNFLQGLYLHKDYHQQPQFTTWKDSNLDSFPNKLTPLAENLCLVDAGYFINASFPPLLREERKVDVIISFDYTLDTPLQAVEQTCNYCTIQGIGFPKVSLTDEEKMTHKECYAFNDEDNNNCPIVLHFPIVNDTFKKFKEPGVLRSPEEMSDGNVDVTGAFSPYFLTNFTYSERDFDRLMNLTQYNLANNRELILDALRSAAQRRKARNLSPEINQTQKKT
ncbi:cytosolic phospholipase A2 epsilon-like isoform X2 [Eleutherodactylus coqui]|uniref:cytosolic phospholipase A2 epsilon-like isoform X2 n=1 Tax=Eleutherodactylus coqui TaxID=57060 RepID=UPI0034618ADB